MDSQDAAYFLAWQLKILPHHSQIIDLLAELAAAGENGDIIAICQIAGDLTDACTDLGLTLNDISPPKHPFLVNSYDSYREAIINWGAAGLSMQLFCETGDVTFLESATLLMEQAIESMTMASEWIEKYRQEIE